MKRIIFAMLGFALTTGAMAQTAKTQSPKTKTELHKKKTENQLENAIAAKKDEKHEAGTALKHGKINKAIKDRKEVRADRRIIHRKARHLKKVHGVKHPILKAQKEVKEDKDEKKGKS